MRNRLGNEWNILWVYARRRQVFFPPFVSFAHAVVVRELPLSTVVTVSYRRPAYDAKIEIVSNCKVNHLSKIKTELKIFVGR